MGACTTTSRICLLCVSLMYWAIAGGFFYVGGYVYVTYSNFEHFRTSSLTLIPATIILAVGVFMFFIGCIGCLAAAKANRFILAVFFCIILFILILQVVASVLAFAFAFDKKLEKLVRNELDKAVENYYNDTVYSREIDYIQKELKCCGVTNYTDWNGGMPSSCYANASHTHVYREGCDSLLVELFEKNLKYIAIVAVAFAIIQVLGLISTCFLFCQTKRDDIPYDHLSNNAGLTV